MRVLEELKSVYSHLEDPRIERHKKHPLLTVLFIVLCSALAGIDDWVGMEDYCEANIDFFSKHFDLTNGVPSHDTIGRVMSRIDISSFQKSFVNFTQLLSKQMKGVIAIDGKTARGSNDLQNTKKALHVVSAWSSANNLVLGQVSTDEKSNEITAIPKLLEMLDLQGQIVTIDAMGCQRDIAKKIIEKEGDYILALKGNQGKLHEDIQFLFDSFECKDWKNFKGQKVEASDKGHGRIETRRVWATEDLGRLLEDHNWPGLRCAIMVESERELKGRKSYEKRLYISSLEADAEKVGRSIRSHWNIENQLHWVLDVTFNEDKSQISKDNAPEAMNIVRKWALNLINKTKGKLSIRRMQNRMKMTGYKLAEILNNEI
jgi:predicted transposase YbfD/YdcC